MKYKVLVIVGLILLSLGVTLMVAGALTDGFDFDFHKMEYSQTEYDSEGIDNIIIDVDASDMVIKKSEDDKIRISTNKLKNMDYEEYINGNTLEITQNNKPLFFNISFSIFETGSYELSIPENLLDKLTVEISAGNLEIKDININECTIDLDAGNLIIENGVINTTNITIDAGNCEINANQIANLYVELDFGNINLNSRISEYAEFILDIGNLDLDLIGSSSDYVINSSSSDKAVIMYDVDLGKEDISYVN